MTVVMLGCLEETRLTLSELAQRGVVPDEIVCLRRTAAASQGITNFVDLVPVAESHGIPCSQVETYSMTSDHDVDLIRRLNPSVLLVVGWQRLVPPAVLELVRTATVGFHGSANILPWGRGRSPINWSIIEGRDRFALHMFLIRAGVDDGDIVGIKIYDINEWDTCRTVYYKTAIAQADLIHLHLPSILSGDTMGLPQRGEAFFYEKRSPEDGLIDWHADAHTICRLVRAVTWPYPGAYTKLRGVDMQVWQAQPFSRDFFAGEPPGRICFVSDRARSEFAVACADGSVLVTDAATDGVEIRVGDMLG